MPQAVSAAFDALGWVPKQTTTGFTADVRVNFWSWGERVTIREVADGLLSIESRCRFPLQVIDWGKNRRNVEALQQVLRELGVSANVLPA